MPTDHENREARQQEILAILDTQRVTSQGELVELLRERGVVVTQSSVSRDLRDLGVGWIGGRYARPVGAGGERSRGGRGLPVPARGQARGAPSHRRLHHRRRRPGRGLAIDRAGWPELVGTMAGDDTVFAATASAGDQKRFIRQARKLPQGGVIMPDPIVLAFSGGLDTSFCIPWLAETSAGRWSP